MKTRKKHPLLVAAVAAIFLAGSGVTWADGSHYRTDRHGYGIHQGYHHQKYRYDSRPHYRHVQKKKVVKHNDNRDDDTLLIGLLVGGLVGYAISHTSQVDNYHYDRYPVTYYAE